MSTNSNYTLNERLAYEHGYRLAVLHVSYIVVCGFALFMAFLI